MQSFSSDEEFARMLCQHRHYLPCYEHVRGDKSGSLKVVDCVACGHRQLSRPVYELALYEQDLQVFSSIKECGTPFQRFVEHSWLQARRRVRRVMADGLLPQKDNTRVDCLDVGGGYGFFSHLLKQVVPYANMDVLDPSQGRIDAGKALIEEYDDAPCYNRYVNAVLDESYVKAKDTTYDLVTLWHVAEHVPDPIQLVANAWQMVKPGGWLSLEVPNANDELLVLSEAFANYSYMIEHLSYFTPKKLKQLVELGAGKVPDTLYGYQRYGIFNYMHWIHANAPLGNDPDFFSGEDRWWLEKNWRETREKALTTDALVVNIQKPVRAL